MSTAEKTNRYRIAYDALNRIIDHDRVGQVEGVVLDIAHPEIDPIHWWTKWGFAGTPLIFPWDDGYVEPSSQGAEPLAEVFDPNEGTPWWKESHDLETPIYVHPGDKISIYQLRHFHRGGIRGLDDPHDVTEAWVTFQITRKNGTRQIVPGTVSFVARDAMGPWSDDMLFSDDGYETWVDDFKISFAKIARRIERLKGDVHKRREWMSLAIWMLGEVRNRIKDRDLENWSAEELVDAASIAGYALAKAESEAKLEPLARAELETQAQRARAAKAGAISRTKSDTPALKQAAAEMCRADPNLSLNKCSAVLADRFGREPTNVRRLIRHLFERRDLANGRVEYRPIRQDQST